MGDKEEYMKLCICERCPSYVVCKPKEKAFCHSSNGKSKCIKLQKGCICGGCPVKAKYGLKNFYFCISGSEEQQNKKK